MKWIVLPYSESYFEEIKYYTNNILVKFHQFFPVIKTTIKLIAFENAHKSSIIFQPFLYNNIPTESPSYAPTFFGRNKLREKIDMDNIFSHAFLSFIGKSKNINFTSNRMHHSSIAKY